MEDIVSKCIVGTCRMLPKINTNVFDSMRSAYDRKMLLYIILCGSSAEFFIQPLRPCFGDVDFFDIRYNLLAFTEEKPVVPYDLCHTADPINCLLMEPYLDYPGFVRLRHLGLLLFNWKDKAFEFIQANDLGILKTTNLEEADRDELDGTWSTLLTGVPSASFRSLKTAFISLGLSHWKR